jgi:hypothetical protein
MLCFSCVLYLEYRAAVSRLYMPLLLEEESARESSDLQRFRLENCETMQQSS